MRWIMAKLEEAEHSRRLREATHHAVLNLRYECHRTCLNGSTCHSLFPMLHFPCNRSASSFASLLNVVPEGRQNFRASRQMRCLAVLPPMIELNGARRRTDSMHVIAAFVLSFQSFSGRRWRADHCDPASQFPYFPIEPDLPSAHALLVRAELLVWSVCPFVTDALSINHIRRYLR